MNDIAQTIPECRICGGTLVRDETSWHCHECGLQYKFVSRYRNEHARTAIDGSERQQKRLRDFMEQNSAWLLDQMERMSCQACRDAKDPRNVAFGRECAKHKAPPSA